MKRWHILLVIGLAGVASLLLATFEQLVPEEQLSFGMRLLILIQPAMLTVAAVATGQALATKLGLGAPLVDSWLTGGNPRAVLRTQVPPALALGIAVGLLMIAYSSAILPSVADATEVAKMTAFNVPLATRILYGGITEELLTRWGLMSFFAWVLWRMTGRGQIRPVILWAAILMAAALFASGHLPFLFAIVAQPQAALILAVLLTNFIPGLLFGWLFWRRGLEAAMLSHALAHCVNALIA
ncbi:abortive infection protein [Agrobacterium sp. TS43]|uniref:CPBP family intramembrane glutamic endopeptidase n=1 Tax=Agrobacterium TaxID=357 RepID=UPI00036BF303|nr:MULTISPECIES: CPBP family intramembrane glutamic endopeptidase [Agrobacterium]EPR19460.1 abortive infection protein [Agrobacterium radiobacter DSM 30147]KDR89569.1 abortive infection protein [Agrobacterium tumefaciens GW4]KVK44948.1 abortive infection protein [Agrobacterium sp. LY4]KVK44993.1 abortive infection protein [Agrobacterium sp. JL28]KVK57980.1 abortive infection protein [Agrobacterium sp. TS45]